MVFGVEYQQEWTLVLDGVKWTASTVVIVEDGNFAAGQDAPDGSRGPCSVGLSGFDADIVAVCTVEIDRLGTTIQSQGEMPVRGISIVVNAQSAVGSNGAILGLAAIDRNRSLKICFDT